MCKNTEGRYAPDSEFLLKVLKENPMFNHEDFPRYELKVMSPLLDSANMNLDDQMRIANEIKRYYHQFSSFVVLHGTDTMSFTASTLSFVLESLEKHVVITGSQKPLSQVYSDGYLNLAGAIILSSRMKISEVTIFFCNKLMRGNRTQKYSAWHLNAFDSATLDPIATFGTELKVNNKLFDRAETPFVYMGKQLFHVAEVSREVGIIYLYPGFQPQVLDTYINFKGLVIMAFGTGNAPSDEQFLSKLQALHDKGCVITVVT